MVWWLRFDGFVLSCLEAGFGFAARNQYRRAKDQPERVQRRHRQAEEGEKRAQILAPGNCFAAPCRFVVFVVFVDLLFVDFWGSKMNFWSSNIDFGSPKVDFWSTETDGFAVAVVFVVLLFRCFVVLLFWPLCCFVVCVVLSFCRFCCFVDFWGSKMNFWSSKIDFGSPKVDFWSTETDGFVVVVVFVVVCVAVAVVVVVVLLCLLFRLFLLLCCFVVFVVSVVVFVGLLLLFLFLFCCFVVFVVCGLLGLKMNFWSSKIDSGSPNVDFLEHRN